MYRSLEVVILEVVSFRGYGLGVFNTHPSADVEAPILKQTGNNYFLRNTVSQCSPWAQQSPARPGPGPWAQGPARTQPVQINDLVAQARPDPYNISPSHYHIYLTIVIRHL